MTQREDDLKALREYDDEARPPCAAANMKTRKQCDRPAEYSVYLLHTHSTAGPGVRFLCERCYRDMLEIPYPIRCVHCKHRAAGPEDMVKDARKI